MSKVASIREDLNEQARQIELETAQRYAVAKQNLVKGLNAGLALVASDFEAIVAAQESFKLGSQIGRLIELGEHEPLECVRKVWTRQRENLLDGHLDPHSTSSVANAEMDVQRRVIRRFVNGWTRPFERLAEAEAQEASPAREG